MKRFYVKNSGELTHMGAFRDVKIVIENVKSYIKRGECFSVNELICDLFVDPILTNIQGEPVVDGDIWLTGQHLEDVSKMWSPLWSQSEFWMNNNNEYNGFMWML